MQFLTRAIFFWLDMSGSKAEVVVYNAILDPNVFDNAKFWKRIAEYKNGWLESKVLHAEKTVGSNWGVLLLDSNAYLTFCYPCLDEMVYMLCGPRLGDGKSEDEAAMKAVLVDCIRVDLVDCDSLVSKINHLFTTYGGNSERVISTDGEWDTRENPKDSYPGFIGHKDFVVPALSQRPIAANFWFSVFFMTAGTVALVCAFAFMQAASLAVGGTVVSVAGGATLLLGMSLFRDIYNAEVANKEVVEQALTGWRPL